MKSLKVQYRMNEKIQNFSSSYFYDNKLIPHETVKNHTLWTKEGTKISTINKLHEVYFKHPLILIDTSSVHAPEMEEPDMKSKYNLLEIKIVEKFTKFLLYYIDQEKIGVITPYSAQVKKLHRIFEDFKELEIETVDGFQGREKEVIILSTVRSNNRADVGFLRDAKRMNVAITRARRLLVLVCNAETLKYDDFLNKMIVYFGGNSFRLTPEFLLSQQEIDAIKHESSVTNNFNQFYNFNKLNHISLNHQSISCVTNKNLIVQQMQGLYKNYLNNYSFSNNYYTVRYNPSLHQTRYDSDLVGFRKATNLNLDASPFIPKSIRLKSRKLNNNQSNKINNDKLLKNEKNEKIYQSSELYNPPSSNELEKENSMFSENSISNSKIQITKKTSKNNKKKKWVEMNVNLKFDRTDCEEVVTHTWKRTQQVKQDKIKKMESINNNIKQKLRQDYYNYIKKDKNKLDLQNKSINMNLVESLPTNANQKDYNVKNLYAPTLADTSTIFKPKEKRIVDLYENKNRDNIINLSSSKNIENNRIDYYVKNIVNQKAENENENKNITTSIKNLNLNSETSIQNNNKLSSMKLQSLVVQAFQEPAHLTLEDFNYSMSKIKFVSCYKNFEVILEQLSKTKILALDTEWFQSKTSIFQISTFTETFLFDLQPDPQNVENSTKRNDTFRKYISQIFLDKSILKVAWDFNHDLEQLLLRFENEDSTTDKLTNKNDVSNYNRLISSYPLNKIENYLELTNYSAHRQGYSNLCKTIYKKSLDKSNQCSNWHIRPLPEDLIVYAALDTISCVDIYKKFIEKQIPIQTDCLVYKVDPEMKFKNIRNNIKSTFLK
jgi:hypothetical protein